MSTQHVLFACIATFVSGCVTVPDSASPYSLAPDPTDGRVNVYIYRVRAIPLMRVTTISIDEREVLDIPEKAYTVVSLLPGKHSFNSKWGWDTGTPSLSFNFEAPLDRPVFLKLSGDFTSRAFMWTVSSMVSKPDQAIAEKELKNCCKFLPNKY